MKFICDKCKKEFEKPQRKRARYLKGIHKHKFCSWKCYLKWRGPRKKRNYKKEYQRRKEKPDYKEQGEEYRKRNREKILKQRRRYYQENRDKIRREDKKRAKTPKYRKQRREYMKRRADVNPKIRINNSISTYIGISLKGKKAGAKWETLVGYTLEDLVKHLQSKFDINMSWQNYGSYWQIDHIRAQSLFNYNSSEDPEFKKCWALKNLQPLEKIENIKKGNRPSVTKLAVNKAALKRSF